MKIVQEFQTIDGNFCYLLENSRHQFNIRVREKRHNNIVFTESGIDRPRVLHLFHLLGIDFINPLSEKVSP